MLKDIEETISKCEICKKHDKIKLINEAAIAIHEDNIFDRWGIDIVGGLPITKEGYGPK